MTGRRRTTGILVCGIALAWSLSTGCGDSDAPSPSAVRADPAGSLLLITVDTLRADHLSACGHWARTTPHLDALSRRGTLIPNAVTPANTTLPAHASLLTSLPPEGHGGFGNGLAIREDLPTLARTCRDAGMATAAMVSSWVLGRGWNLEQGFDEYFPLYKTEGLPGGVRESVEPLRAEDTSRAAGRWLRANAGRPYMLWLHYMDPHQEYDPPPPFDNACYRGIARPRTPKQFLELYRVRVELPPATTAAVRADYAGEVAYTDRCIGEVLSLLQSLGLEQNTLVVVAADHGEALNEKECYYGHSLSLGEAVNRVPLILAGPGVAAGVLGRPVTLLDAAPTILALLGLAVPDRFQGRDLSRLIRASSTAGGEPAALADPLLFTRGEDGRRAWLVDGLKATFDPEGRITALYDLQSDPLEMNDLREQQPGLAGDLARRYMAPHTELASMAAKWASGRQDRAGDETRNRLRELGYHEE